MIILFLFSEYFIAHKMHYCVKCLELVIKMSILVTEISYKNRNEFLFPLQWTEKAVSNVVIARPDP